MVQSELENLLRTQKIISREENWTVWYRQGVAIANNMLQSCNDYLERYKDHHPLASDNDVMQYARTLGAPLASPETIHFKVIRMMSGRLLAL